MKNPINHLAHWGLILVLLLPLCAAVHAGEGDALQVSGFGTLGVAQDDRQDMATVRDISQRPHDGSQTGPSWQLDTRLGVQMEYRMSPGTALVGQVVARDRAQADTSDSVEMAYLALQPLPRLGVRLGRVGYDAFLMSDYRHVGYAYAWVRPPGEFYSWIPIFSVDGVDGTYRFDAGGAQWSVKAQAGVSQANVPIGLATFNFETRNLRSVSVTRQSDLWRVKAAYSAFSVGSEVTSLDSLRAGLGKIASATRQLIPSISAEAADLSQQLVFQGSQISYATLGAVYDDGRWFAQAELGRATSSSSIGTRGDMAYIGAGRRWGDWTAFARYSVAQQGNTVRSASADWRVLGLQDVQAKAISVLNATRIDQATLSLGGRWDFHKQAALKLQWDATQVKPHGYALWWHDEQIGASASRVNLLSATLDFVF
jgi:hypothetical protein